MAPAPAGLPVGLLVRSQILCVLLFLLAVALTPNGQWWTWLVYGLALAIVLERRLTPWLALLQRVSVEFGFIILILASTLFREGGTVLWHWGGLQVTTEGLTIFGSLTLKAVLSMTALTGLVITTPIPVLLQGLVDLRVPPLLVAMMAAMHRYTLVLMDEFQTMQRAARSRNLMGNPQRQRLIIGYTIAALFIRTYDRADRIHQAMLARGYQGIPPSRGRSQSQWRDWRALTVTLVILLLGQGVGWIFRMN